METGRPQAPPALRRAPSTAARLADVVRGAFDLRSESVVRELSRAASRGLAAGPASAREEPVSRPSAALHPRRPLRLPFHRRRQPPRDRRLVAQRREGPLLPGAVARHAAFG